MMTSNDGEEDKLTYSEIFNYIVHDQYPGAYCRKRKNLQRSSTKTKKNSTSTKRICRDLQLHSARPVPWCLLQEEKNLQINVVLVRPTVGIIITYLYIIK